MSVVREHQDTWRGVRRAVLVAALLCGAAFLASEAIDGEPAELKPLTSFYPDHPACDLAATPTLRRADGTEQADLTSIRLNSNAFLIASLCQPTLLRLTAEGTAVDGVGARLAIHLGDTPLFDDDLTGALDLELRAPSPGWLIIAFTNDLYRPPLDRNLWLRNIELLPSP